MSRKFYCNDSVSPVVMEENKLSSSPIDVFSRLLADRIIFLGDEINDEISNIIVAQLLYLDNSSKSHEPINLYLNTPGGIVSGGLAIYDTIKMIKSPVITTCVGCAASMGAVLMSAGLKGERRILRHSRIMIHQPSGGCRGMESDIEISAKLIKQYKKELYEILAENTGKTIEEITKDGDRDFWMTAQEAVDYGIADKII